jgi:hypothetical protein
MSAQQGLYVERHYEMDPKFEDVIYGWDLRDGMVVLIEDALMRGDPARMHEPHEGRRVRECNAWCRVEQLRATPGPQDPLVSFMGVYGDGVKRPRTYAASYAWIVKKDSLPGTAS